jgi:hypothetical protein
MNTETTTQPETIPPLPPSTGSATCGICKWTNVSLLNLGEPGNPRWTCHGCCKRMLEALERILRYPVHSEPVGGAMAMQDIAHETLSPNSVLEP